MSLYDTLRADFNSARTAKDERAKALLGPLVSDAYAIGKDKRRGDPTEEEVIALVKKFLKGANETVAALEKDRRTDSPKYATAVYERATLERYLPAQMSDNDIAEIARAVMARDGLSGPKAMGPIMKHLRDEHAGRYDGARASAVVKDIVNS